MLDYAMIEHPQVWVSLFFSRVVLHTHCKTNTGLLFSREKSDRNTITNYEVTRYSEKRIGLVHLQNIASVRCS